MNVQELMVFAGIPMAALATGVWARGQAKRDPARRAALIRRAITGVVTGIVLAWGIWYVGPTNRESPAMILTYFVSWIVGGGVVLLSAALWIGAAGGRQADR